VFKVEEGFFTDRLNDDWSGLVGTSRGSECDDNRQQNKDGCDRIAVGLVERKHLYYVYIFFLKCVKGNLIVSL